MMRYTVNGRSQSFISAGLAILLAVAMHASAAIRSHSGAQSAHAGAATEARG